MSDPIGNLSSRDTVRRFDAELARLRGDGVLDEAQAHAVTEALATAMRQAERRSSRRWVEILAYLGGALVLTGALLLLGRTWELLGRGGRASALGGAAVLLLIAAVAIAGGSVERLRGVRRVAAAEQRRLISTLFTLSAFTAAASIGSYLEDDGGTLYGGLVCLAIAALGYLVAPSLFGHAGMLFGALLAAIGLTVELEVDRPAPVGLLIMGVGLVWTLLAWRRVFTEAAPGLAAGLAVMIAGAQGVIGDEPVKGYGYGLAALVCAVAFAAYLWRRRWLVLVVALVGFISLVVQLANDLAPGSVGVVWVLLAIGAVLLVISAVALRRPRGAAPQPPSNPSGGPPPGRPDDHHAREVSTGSR